MSQSYMAMTLAKMAKDKKEEEKKMHKAGWVVKTQSYELLTGFELQDLLNKINDKPYSDVIANQPFPMDVEDGVRWKGFVTLKVNLEEQAKAVFEESGRKDEAMKPILPNIEPEEPKSVEPIKINLGGI